VRAGEPSRTAFGAALLRALHQDLDEPRIFTDPLAWRILGGDRDGLRELGESSGPPGLRRFVAARHRFAEDSLARAVAAGTTQVVVLGAGFDTFAYRNPFPGTRVFEVDHPATGAWKRERLAEAGIAVPGGTSYVGVDFEREDFLAVLADHGFDATRPAFFLWLGVVPYLTREAVASTLASVARIPRGEVVLDHTGPAEQLSGRTRAAHADLRDRVAGLGEPLTAGWDPEELDALLRRLGFAEIEALGRRDIRARYLGQPPTGPSTGGRIVRARMPR
jgi:methyltransferase (TIGR00027 family)